MGLKMLCGIVLQPDVSLRKQVAQIERREREEQEAKEAAENARLLEVSQATKHPALSLHTIAECRNQ